MKRTLIIISTVIFCILLIVASIYSYKKANTVILQGEVEVKTINLSSKLSARVNKINVQKGDYVKKGDILIELDAPEVDAKAQQAQAMLEFALAQQEKTNNGSRKETIGMAKANYDVSLKTYTRMKNLYAEGVIPAQKLDEASAKYQAAKEQYDMALNGARYEDKLSVAAGVNKAKGANAEVYAYQKENKIVASIDGIVTEISVEEGELVGAGFPVITLADNDDAWVTFNIREDFLPYFKNGKEIDITIPAISKKPIKAKVNYISVLGNFATWRATRVKGEFDMKTFEVRAIPVEKNPDLRAGMSVILDWKKQN